MFWIIGSGRFAAFSAAVFSLISRALAASSSVSQPLLMLEAMWSSLSTKLGFKPALVSALSTAFLTSSSLVLSIAALSSCCLTDSGTSSTVTATGFIEATCIAISRQASSEASALLKPTIVASLPLKWLYATTFAASIASYAPISIFSPVLPVSSTMRSATVRSPRGRALSSSMFLALAARAASRIWLVRPLKPSVAATKSVSHLRETTAANVPHVPAIARPSEASRSSRLAAIARPFLRMISMAASMSLLVSTRAFLQSMMPAPVILRSLLISAIVTAIY